jgi:hypothetical protein
MKRMTQKQTLAKSLPWMLVTVLFVVGCGTATDQAMPTATRTTPPASTATPVPTDTPSPTNTPASQAQAVIAPTSGPPGTEVELVASGLPPNAELQLGAGRANSEYDVIDTATADSSGSLQARLSIPGFAEAGELWVMVVDVVGSRTKVVSNNFEVTGDNLFTRTNIFLIAVGDDGSSGKAIGCGDSVIPVEIEIEPTIAPLTAALEHLLALDSRDYGQSGLYHALYQSELVVEGVNIVDGEAIIELSGSLQIGGVCDAPRVEAQIEETALQYDTVDSVSVTINDTPLEELLSGN